MSNERTPVGDVVRMTSGKIFTPEQYKKEIYEKYSGMRVFGPYPKTTKNICPCSDPIMEIENLAKGLLDDIGTYKDITVGGVEIEIGRKRKPLTTFDIVENIEKKVKKIIVQKNVYDRCCFPEGKIPRISEEEIMVESPAEYIEAMKKIVEKETH